MANGPVWGTIVGIAIVGALLLTPTQKKELMHIGCKNLYMTRVQLNAEIESKNPDRIVAALNEQQRLGNCATTQRGAWPDNFIREAELGKMSCVGQSCGVFIRTDIFERLKDGRSD